MTVRNADDLVLMLAPAGAAEAPEVEAAIAARRAMAGRAPTPCTTAAASGR